MSSQTDRVVKLHFHSYIIEIECYSILYSAARRNSVSGHFIEVERYPIRLYPQVWNRIETPAQIPLLKAYYYSLSHW